MSAKDLLDNQLEAILLKETERLHNLAAVMPLELDDVRKLSLLIEINEKRKDKRPSDDALTRPKGTFSLEELLKAVENDRGRQADGTVSIKEAGTISIRSDAPAVITTSDPEDDNSGTSSS